MGSRIATPFHATRVSDDHARPIEDLHLVLRLAHLELAADVASRHFVAVGVDVDVGLEVDDPRVDAIDGRAPRGQGLEPVALGGEQVTTTAVEFATELGIDLVAPHDGLAIGVVEVAELAVNEEVILHVVEQAFDHREAVGIPLLVGPELEPTGLAEGGHLGARHHVFAGATEHDDAGVVDHADRADAIDIIESIVEEDLALEAREAWVQLHEGDS